jgi:glycosyltransferase involved in cell wall biosynthesis
MRIAIYVPSWPPGFSANGIVTYAAQLVPQLRQLGHEVFILTYNEASPTVDEYTINLASICTDRPILSRLKAFFVRDFDPFCEKLLSVVKMLTRRYHIDVIEIEESFGWGGRIAQLEIVPVVIRLHGPWFLNGSFDGADPTPSRERVDREGRAIANATMVTAPSANVLENVRKYYKLDLGLARVIPNPFQSGDDAKVWRLDACDPNRILYVGRFDRRKGGDLVLRAFANLAEFYPNLRLSFVGPDDGVSDGGSKLSFDQFVRKNIQESSRTRIDFHGALTNEQVMSLRRQHFFTIVASQFEILPYAVIEAMSCGCPVIASSVGGIPELIKDQSNGILYPSQSIGELVSACRRLLDDPALAATLGKQAHEDCKLRLNARRVALETVSAYSAAGDLFRKAR